jgi:hypothetical protein
MKPRSTFAKDHLLEIYPDPVPWVGEVFDHRIETLLESPDIDNRDRMMIRLRASLSRREGDARHLLKYLKQVLPELFNKELLAEIAKEENQRKDSMNSSGSAAPTVSPLSGP